MYLLEKKSRLNAIESRLTEVYCIPKLLCELQNDVYAMCVASTPVF